MTTVTDESPGNSAASEGDGRHSAAGTEGIALDRSADERLRARHTLWIHVFTWMRNIGALIILFAAWQLWGTAIAQQHSQETLKKQFAATVHEAASPQARFSLLPASENLPVAPSGAVVAQLQIPKIGVSQYVVSGTAEDDLAKGPGHYVGTAEPGQAGNVAIAGHRTTHGAPFNRLAELAPGDPIYLTDLAGQRLTYVVALAPFAVSPSDVSVLTYFGDDRLTLTTCNPEYSAAQRLIVVSLFVSGPSAKLPVLPAHRVVASDGGVPQKVIISGEAGWNTGLIPVVLVEVGLLVALGLTNRRWSRYLTPGSRWLVLLPIWTAGLFILFQGLTGFLPAAA